MCKNEILKLIKQNEDKKFTVQQIFYELDVALCNIYRSLGKLKHDKVINYEPIPGDNYKRKLYWHKRGLK